LAKSVHPLLITRGVPGTHDVCLAHETIDKLIAIKSGEFAMIPRFSKITDDREPREQWSEVCGPVDIIILEGWCVGMMPQAKMDLIPHVNSLEEMEDSDRIWRNYVNQQLLEPYQTLFNRLNCLAVLNAPSFSCVFEWRLLQEQKLAVKLTADGRRDESQKLLTGEKVKRFIAHYQRLTEFGLEELPKKADWLMRLDLSHNIISLEEKIE
jgi:D-glycerate 3-kinase